MNVVKTTADTNALSRAVYRPNLSIQHLLQVILLTNLQDKQAAFHRWQESIALDDIPYAQFGLMGELAHLIDEVAPNYAHKSRLLGMQKYVWSNNIRILHPALSVIDAFNQQGLTYLVLKGGGVIAKDPSFLYRRFIRDLDLMVLEADIPRAAEILVSLGWRPCTGRIPGPIRAQAFDKRITDQQGNSYRVEIDLHRSALHLGRHGRADDVFFKRTEVGQLLGRSVPILAAPDWALVSVMHGLVYSESPNYAWLVDAVRALQTPGLDTHQFVATLQERSLIIAAQPILDYLSEGFQVNLPKTKLAVGGLLRSLYEKEAQAIACSRQERGWWGRCILWLAELCRSKSWGHFVDYRSDWGVYAKRSWVSAFVSPGQEGVIYELKHQNGQPELEVQIARDSQSAGRADFDVFLANRWLVRVRLRSRMPGLRHGGGVWRVRLPVSQDLDLMDVRCEATISQ